MSKLVTDEVGDGSGVPVFACLLAAVLRSADPGRERKGREKNWFGRQV